MNLNCCDHNRFSINSNVKICIYQINNKINPLIKSHLFFRSCIGIIIFFFGIELILWQNIAINIIQIGSDI